MDTVDSTKSNEKSCGDELKTSELVEVDNCNSTLNLKSEEINYDINPNEKQNVFENLETQNAGQNLDTCGTNKAEDNDAADSLNFNDDQGKQNIRKESPALEVPVLHETNNSLSNVEDKSEENNIVKVNVAVVKALRPLCADYKSESESESVDSEADSSTVSGSSTSDTSSKDEYSSDESYDSDADEKEKIQEDKKLKKELSLIDLSPIEDLKISVPEDACVEIGTITSIVETLVVVESYKGTAALDLDTVLFLDCGKRTLGKVFDILGPINEPVYTVRFNSQEQMKKLNITKDLKVYYAPKTQHTTFVFMSEVLKNRGSDASWKDNTEAPPEFQDFSDDEQERLHTNKQVRETEGFREQNKSKKRSYKNIKPNSGAFQPKGFRNPNFCLQSRPNIQRNPMGNQSVPLLPQPPPGHPNFLEPIQPSPFPYNVPPPHPSVSAVPIPPRTCFPPRFSGPPFPSFGNLLTSNGNQNFQNPFQQQRTHGYLQSFGSWGSPARPMFRYQLQPPPPPPPPPPSSQPNGYTRIPF